MPAAQAAYLSADEKRGMEGVPGIGGGAGVRVIHFRVRP